MKKFVSKIFLICVITMLMNGCVGPDYMPDYFGLYGDDSDTPAASETETPDTSEPKDLGEATITKLVVGSDGRQQEVPIPDNRILEVGTGVYISQSETDIGDKYRATAKFKILNSGSKAIDVNLPPQIGPFFISSVNNLQLTLSPKQFMVISITFYPKSDYVGVGGKINEELMIGELPFELSGIALNKTGHATINIIDRTGESIVNDAAVLTFSEIALAAHPQRQFFECEQVSCDGTLRFTNCRPCINMLSGNCELLPVNNAGSPIDIVDGTCKPANEDNHPASEINLSSSDFTTVKAKESIIEIINSGPEPLIIDSIKIAEIEGSNSTKQFSINKNALFVAESFKEVENNIFNAFESGKKAENASFPIVLPPYDPPELTTRLFIVASYHPKDILGSDGAAASVGNSAKDEAILKIKSEGDVKELYLAGTTTIKEIPALQVYVKSSIGLRPISDGDELPFRGITTETADLAIPLFMKLSDSSTVPLKISGIRMTGNNFEWLDTKDKIDGKPEESRCSIPILDDEGNQIDVNTDVSPVSLNPSGFTLEPGIYSVDDMPLFGCINFHRDTEKPLETVTFQADLAITAQEMTSSGEPALNQDGSVKETIFNFSVLGVIDPLKGKLVLRLTQTMSAVLNAQFPGLSSVASKNEMDILIANGRAKETDRKIFLISIFLDPFDEDGDGYTAEFLPIDTRAVPVVYNDPYIWDYTSLTHDSLLPFGEQGIFDGYENLPDTLRTNGLKVFTSTLSYPGPLAPPEERPAEVSECEIIDPCTAEGQRKLGEGNNNPNYKGVCTFFYATAGSYNSPAFHYPNEPTPGTRRAMCEDREKKYDLNTIKGYYFLDGRMEFPNTGLLFQGPTYFHNPYSPLGSEARALDEMFNFTFTTEPLLPLSDTKTIDRIPDKRVDIAKGEYKINLNDPYSDLPAICESNSKNRFIEGEYYSSWRYIAPLLKKDKAGKVPAGCPEEDNNFTGGIAYLSGKRLNHETGHATFIGAGKFSSSNGLTFAFKDIMLFLILNGWFCDPAGDPAQMEGGHCFDMTFNYRDAISQYSILGDK